MPLPKPLPTQIIQPDQIRQSLIPILAFPSMWWTQDPPPSSSINPVTFLERYDQACRRDERNSLGAIAFIKALRTAHLLRIIDAEFKVKDGAEPLERALARSSVRGVKLLTGRYPGADDWCKRVQKSLAINVRLAISEMN